MSRVRVQGTYLMPFVRALAGVLAWGLPGPGSFAAQTTPSPRAVDVTFPRATPESQGIPGRAVAGLQHVVRGFVEQDKSRQTPTFLEFEAAVQRLLLEFEGAHAAGVRISLAGRPLEASRFTWDGRTLWLDATITVPTE